MEPQLYMWSGTRGIYLKRHRFYAEQIRKRVLSQFSNIEEEAKSIAEAEYERLGSHPASEDDHGEMAAYAEQAWDTGTSLYMLLDDLRIQTWLGALAGMYHQWDKDLRDFLEDELAHAYKRAEVKEHVWGKADIGKIYDLIEQFGWPVRQRPWFPTLDACRLVVNVYKHGKGASLEQLAKKYPDYLKPPYQGILPDGMFEPNHEHLGITEEQFSGFDKAIENFWLEFPERLYLTS